MLSNWPKVRPLLAPEYAAIYEDHMARNRGGGSFVNRAALLMEEWMHRKTALPAARNLLELGAGNLNHFRFEPPSTAYSVIEPLESLIRNSPLASKVNYLGNYDDLIKLSRAGQHTFDKILSVAVLEHLEDLPSVIAASAILLAEDGTFVAGIPSEGGKLWRLSWMATTGRAFRKRYRLDYGQLMASEHLNEASEIEHVIRHFFSQVRIRRFPGPSLDLSLYTAILARGPRWAAAHQHLQTAHSPR